MLALDVLVLGVRSFSGRNPPRQVEAKSYTAYAAPTPSASSAGGGRTFPLPVTASSGVWECAGSGGPLAPTPSRIPTGERYV